LYARSGYLRFPDEHRRRTETWRTYKHGHELRFKALDEPESARVVALLRVVGIDAGRPYMNLDRVIVPVYGKRRVLQAIRNLRLKRRATGAPKRRPAMPRAGIRATARWPGTAEITSVKQLDATMLIYSGGPRAAEESHVSISVLTVMRKRGLVKSITGDLLPAKWRLTPKGKNRMLQARKSYLDWMRARPARGHRR
jgi:hypothetical protein